MGWKKLLESISESIHEDLRLRHAYLLAKNRLMRQQINGRVQLTDSERKEPAERRRPQGGMNLGLSPIFLVLINGHTEPRDLTCSLGRSICRLCSAVRATIDAWSARSVVMEQQTLDKLAAAIEAVAHDLAGRVAELARKSASGTLSTDEKSEYEQIVQLNDLLSLLKLQAESYWSPRLAS